MPLAMAHVALLDISTEPQASQAEACASTFLPFVEKRRATGHAELFAVAAYDSHVYQPSDIPAPRQHDAHASSFHA
jgi:hypothetical protein